MTWVSDPSASVVFDPADGGMSVFYGHLGHAVTCGWWLKVATPAMSSIPRSYIVLTLEERDLPWENFRRNFGGQFVLHGRSTPTEAACRAVVSSAEAKLGSFLRESLLESLIFKR